ncbi:MAG: 2-oxoacid:acceptor oxidoreductase family protein [Bryobacteraceae bacterium]|nr:2-oxoacid:acceptor oxidoreductase family protein [Bryobacteraceae bacterium]
MSVTEIRVAGFGGQGVMLAADIIGKAACIYAGGYATKTQNYGPEARGGASSGALVLSKEPILYPYTTSPHILVALSQEAYSRFMPEMDPNGVLIVEEDLVPIGAELPSGVRVYRIPATRMAEELGRKIVMNVIVVGYFAAVSGILEKRAFLDSVTASVPEKALALNLRAFEAGYNYGRNVAVESAEPMADAVER